MRNEQNKAEVKHITVENETHEIISEQIKEHIEKYKISSEFEEEHKDLIKDVPGDGHCLLHCVNATLKIRKQKCLASIKLMMEDKAFQPFFTPKSKSELEKYIDKASWQSNAVDIVPNMLSKGLEANFIIINLNGKELQINEILQEKS